MTNINDKIESFELDTDQGIVYSKDHADKNLVLVIGENMDLGGVDAGARNGTGKTTIINALSYVLLTDSPIVLCIILGVALTLKAMIIDPPPMAMGLLKIMA